MTVITTRGPCARLALYAALAATLPMAPTALGQSLGDYLNVESPQVSPVTQTTALGTRYLLVCNTPDNSLELWSVDESQPADARILDRLPTGLEPVSVIADGDTFWVVNFLGDSIIRGRITGAGGASAQLELLRSVNVGDEPWTSRCTT